LRDRIRRCLQRGRAQGLRGPLPREREVRHRNRCRGRQVCDQGVKGPHPSIRREYAQVLLREGRRSGPPRVGHLDRARRGGLPEAGRRPPMSKLKFLRRRSGYYRHFTVLDIGTDLIKVLVIRREGLDGEVLGVGREPQAPAAMSGGEIADLESVIQACNRAVEAAEDMARTVPGQVVVGIAGELIKGFSSTIAYPRDTAQAKVRAGEVSSMLQMVQRRALREAQHLLELERSYGQLEARLVHSAITNIRVDGYPVTNPVGFTGKNLEITVFNTFAPMTHIDAIDTVVRELDLELAAAVAQPYALARACASEETWAEGGIFVDIGGGTTDVALVRDGGVEGTRMFN